MRVLVISDVHANLTALDEVLADAESFVWLGKPGFDVVWSIGDIVGYGPHPNQCVERLRQFDEHVRVAGNHDWAALARINIDDFNPEARKMVRWTQHELDEPGRAYLADLPDKPIERADYTITHASPREPIWEYINSVSLAQANFEHFASPFCIVGHTHVPRVYRLAADLADGRPVCTAHSPVYDQDVVLSGKHRLIINPGSVGQPRDSDPRASYALLDTEEHIWRFRRIPYAYEVTQAHMRKAGLPERLIARLTYGW
jgi:diadenosine tetraphosphatase ApaH/serine/threonine PP2A family protein phosphatase